MPFLLAGEIKCKMLPSAHLNMAKTQTTLKIKDRHEHPMNSHPQGSTMLTCRRVCIGLSLRAFLNRTYGKLSPRDQNFLVNIIIKKMVYTTASWFIVS